MAWRQGRGCGLGVPLREHVGARQTVFVGSSLAGWRAQLIA